jgi:hypothetical protein
MPVFVDEKSDFSQEGLLGMVHRMQYCKPQEGEEPSREMRLDWNSVRLGFEDQLGTSLSDLLCAWRVKSETFLENMIGMRPMRKDQLLWLPLESGRRHHVNSIVGSMRAHPIPFKIDCEPAVVGGWMSEPLNAAPRFMAEELQEAESGGAQRPSCTT